MVHTEDAAGFVVSRDQQAVSASVAKWDAVTNRLMNWLSGWRAMIWAGVAAGVVSALFQALLWLVFTDELPSILYRDARLTAAIMLGSSVLPPPMTFDVVVMLAATLIHFAISITCAALLAILTARLGTTLVPWAGIGFGVALYVVNLYGFTAIFPWFAQTRGWITLVTHGVFGLTAILVYRRLVFKVPSGMRNLD